MNEKNLLAATGEIVAAAINKQLILRADIPDLIMVVKDALAIQVPRSKTEATPVLKPSVSVDKSVHDDYLICLEDGKKFKSLKRHLVSHFNMTPQQYREKWGLPADYPMVAPNYAAQRSALAKQMGLGRKVEKLVPKKRKAA